MGKLESEAVAAASEAAENREEREGAREGGESASVCASFKCGFQFLTGHQRGGGVIELNRPR